MLKLSGFFYQNVQSFNVNSKNAITLPENVFGFFDNCIWIGSDELSVLWRKYSSSAVNVLTSRPKILDLTKNAVLQLNLIQNNEKVL